jgi:hypothetical protein
MEAFEIAYDDEKKEWIKRPCVRPRDVVVARPRYRWSECALVTVSILVVTIIVFNI